LQDQKGIYHPEGYWDLSNWNFEKKGPLQIDQGWEYLPDTFIMKRDSNSHSDEIDDENCTIDLRNPKSCFGYQLHPKFTEFTRSNFPQTGIELPHTRNTTHSQSQKPNIGIYRIKIRGPIQNLSLFNPYGIYHTSARIWVKNKTNFQLIQTIGLPDPNPSVQNNLLGSTNAFIPPQSDSEWEVWIELSNYSLYEGTLPKGMKLGTIYQCQKAYAGKWINVSIISGMLLIAGIYFIILYLFNKNERTNFLFGLTCLIIMLREFSLSRLLETFYPEYSNFSAIVRLEFVTMPMSVLSFHYFIFFFYNKLINKKILLLNFVYSLFLLFFVFFGSTLSLSKNLILFQFQAIATFTYIFYRMIRLLFSDNWVLREKSIFSLPFYIATFIFVGYDITKTYINTFSIEFMTSYGVIIFLLNQALLLARNNAIIWNSNEKLKANLESEVNFRTDAYKLEKEKANQAFKELVETQEALSRSERNATMNSLVAHLAHEINNPLNYLSTGEVITKESFSEAKNLILQALSDSEESRSFREKISKLFSEVELGFAQSSLGTNRIRDTIAEIRAITGVDGHHLENFNPIPLIYSNLLITLEKNQIPENKIEIQILGKDYRDPVTYDINIISQKYIFSRSIRTVLNNSIYFANKATNPKVDVKIFLNKNLIGISIKNNGPVIEQGKEGSLFDSKTNRYFGTEILGLSIIKDLLKKVQCNISLVDNGRLSGWVELLILLKNYE
jgi:signal transduction histidine kinase